MSRRWALAGVVTLPLAAAVIYLIGLVQGHFVDLESNSEWCRQGPLEYPYSTWQLVPLSSRCHYEGGSNEQLVPGWINPSLALLILLMVVSVVTLVRGRRVATSTTNVDGTRDDA